MKRIPALTLIAWFLTLNASLPAQTTPDFARARDEAVRMLQELIRIDTSNPPGNETKTAEYLKAILDREGIPSEILALDPARGNLVARLKGNGTKKPLLMMAHTDVVGVERDKWTVDPFAGVIQDGYVYGRGAVDDKDDVATMFQVFLMLHRQRIRLDRDVIFLAAAGEEGGAPVGAKYLVEQHWPKIEAEFALNEGGATHVRDDGKVEYVGIQTAEKLPGGIRLLARGVSGHGSIPRPDNPVVRLGTAVAKAAEYQPPMKLNETTRVFFERLARISSPEDAALLTHLEDPSVQEKLRNSTNRSHLVYNSMIRTSISPNIIRAGFRFNVIPAEAEAILDVRLLPGESREELIEELRRVINDPSVEVSPAEDLAPMPPSPVSRLDSEMFRALEKAQATVFPEAITLPTMSTGATDSSHLRAKGVQSFGVGAVGTDTDLGRAHGNDERVGIEGYGKFLELIYRAVVEVAASR